MSERKDRIFLFDGYRAKPSSSSQSHPNDTRVSVTFQQGYNATSSTDTTVATLPTNLPKTTSVIQKPKAS